MPILKRNKSTIYGLNAELQAINTTITDEVANRKAAQGTLADLTTTDQASLVAAINEVKSYSGDIESAALQAANNLSELTDFTAARTNLDVYSTTEVTAAIDAAQINMGSNYNAATITERDAMVDLDLGDRVFVADDGDGKWALYKPSAVDENGTGTAWVKLSDQDSLENSISAASLKQSYESNADTNAYTDADKTTVGHLTVTAPINLDEAVLQSNLKTDLTGSASDTEVPSAKAVKDYVSASAPIYAIENPVVTADKIVLGFEPANGVAGIMNFATVRFIDGNNVAYDAPVVATANPGEFTVSVDTPGEWDGETVQVQYVHNGVAVV